jgi:hypothetical protein
MLQETLIIKVFIPLTWRFCYVVRGKVNKQVTNHDTKETNGDNGIQTTFIFQRNLHTNLNTCPTVSQVPGNLWRKILVVALRTTRALLFQPHHHKESVLPKDVVLEGQFWIFLNYNNQS